MNILNIEHVSKLYGDKWIFDDISCGIQEGEKIGIIGINGTGKTTLLRILTGAEEPDRGQVVRQNGLKIAVLTQNNDFPEEETVLSYTASAIRQEEWDADNEAKSMLNTLGLTDHAQKLSGLSGGQKKRAALARTLLTPSDVLVLDEPTNHLDEEMIRWLEQYLKRYRGTVILVTHDRYFLDQVTNRILEISRGKLYSYEANYSRFLELKAQREEMELAAERKRQSILRMELSWAARGCRARSTKQRARLERLEALKAGRAPEFDKEVELDSVETRMGKKTIELHGVSKSYGDKNIVEDFSYIFLKNQTVAFVGPNGCGKSTLLKIIAGQLEPDSGTVELGETIRLGYFAQEIPDLDESQRVIDYVKDIAEYIPTREGRISASQMLERFLFTPDMQYAPIGKLSGGEKRRLYLLSVLQAAPNVLVMDEVSNELDIPTLAVLEDYLNSFIGIVILVSHDRYFLDNTVDRIFAFDGDGHFRQYEGGYTDYMDKSGLAVGKQEDTGASGGKNAGKSGGKRRADTGENTDAGEGPGGAGKKRGSYRQPGREKLRFSFAEQKEYETIDDDIAALEEKMQTIDAEIAKNATDFVKLNEWMQEKETTQKQLDEKTERWVYLNDLAERIEAQKNQKGQTG